MRYRLQFSDLHLNVFRYNRATISRNAKANQLFLGNVSTYHDLVSRGFICNYAHYGDEIRLRTYVESTGSS
jgi:hypothetical protein